MISTVNNDPKCAAGKRNWGLLCSHIFPHTPHRFPIRFSEIPRRIFAGGTSKRRRFFDALTSYDLTEKEVDSGTVPPPDRYGRENDPIGWPAAPAWPWQLSPTRL